MRHPTFISVYSWNKMRYTLWELQFRRKIRLGRHHIQFVPQNNNSTILCGFYWLLSHKSDRSFCKCRNFDYKLMTIIKLRVYTYYNMWKWPYLFTNTLLTEEKPTYLMHEIFQISTPRFSHAASVETNPIYFYRIQYDFEIIWNFNSRNIVIAFTQRYKYIWNLYSFFYRLILPQIGLTPKRERSSKVFGSSWNFSSRRLDISGSDV